MDNEEVIEQSPVAKQTRAAKAVPAGEKRIWIIVHKDGRQGAEKEVFVGVNGVGYRIVRGSKVEVPESVVNVLEEAVTTTYEHVRQPDGSTSLVASDSPTYPYSIVG